MKSIWLLFTPVFVLLVTGCATKVPFEEYLAPDGTRTWKLEIDEATAKFHAPKTDEDLIAEQMAWSRFCTNGYRIDRSTPLNGGRVCYGTGL